MTLRTYLLLFAFATIVAWVGWISIVVQVDPTVADGVMLFAFYISFFVGLFGLFSLVGFFFRVWLSTKERIFQHLGASSRQGALLSAFLCVLLYLQSRGYLYWWNILLLLAAIIITEFFFLSSSGKDSHGKSE